MNNLLALWMFALAGVCAFHGGQRACQAFIALTGRQSFEAGRDALIAAVAMCGCAWLGLLMSAP